MPRRYRHTYYDPVLSRGILAIVLIVAAVVIVLSFFSRAGAVGIMLNDYLLSFLFGSIRYTAPAILLILAWFLFQEKELNYRRTHLIGSILFFLAASSLMHISFETKAMWRMALDGSGGGAFGMLAWPLKEYLGIIAGVVILIGMAAMSVFLIFNTSLTHFVLLNKKLFAGLGLWGKAIIDFFGLFVKNNGQQKITINGDYDKNEEEERPETQETPADTEEENNKRKFFSKEVRNEDEEDAEIDHDGNIPDVENRKPSVWDKKIIVKNLPKLDLLVTKKTKPTSGDIEANAAVIKDLFAQFNIGVEMGEVRVGPTVTQYSLKPDKGIKLTKITALNNDLSLALAAHPIRMEAPIPGQSLVGIEVPNTKVAMVTLKELLEASEFHQREHNYMIALGKDVAGKVWFADLPKMPHLLVAGATGSGKTVCINTIIMSLLYQNTAETLRFIMVDPKRVELTLYNGIPHLLTPVITNIQKTVNALKWTIGEMDRRFDLLAQSGSRDINSYNNKYPDEKLPHIVFIIDELADLMAAAASEVEAGIIRLAQMARAVGLHLIVATQRPSVDIITGLMKANIPCRIAFSVPSLIDSRTILDCPGAEKLLGRGDMLFLNADMSKPKRLQGAYVSEEEVNNVVNYLKSDGVTEYDETIIGKQPSGTINLFGGPSDSQDPLFNEAKHAILEAGKASASLLQRRLKIGYARAARILDEMESAGIIGPADGAKPREILSAGRDEPETMDAGGEMNVFDEGNKKEQAEKTEGIEENDENSPNPPNS